jgi:ketosteroid isomerase-like protein
MHFLRFTAFACILGTSAACAPAPSSSSSEQDVADITRTTHDWVATFEAGDVAGTLTFLTQDVVLVPPNQPAVIGAAAIEAWSQSMSEPRPSRKRAPQSMRCASRATGL